MYAAGIVGVKEWFHAASGICLNLAGVYKIAGVKVREASNDVVLRRGLLYDLRSGRGVLLQVERAEQALLHLTHAG
jgi:hypothetical protein